jgi:trk system potassium uptake protein TrkA
MKSNKTYAVFGLGRYGLAVARELVANGKEVIAVDMSQAIVNDVAAYLPVCKCADVTDSEVISRLGISSIDTVIICMAGNLEASVMAVTLCKEAGVRTVIAKCANEMQQKILLRVGADQVVFPEKDIAYRIAVRECCDTVFDYISLSGDYGIFEISVPADWVGKTPRELNIRAAYNLTVLAAKQQDKVNPILLPDYVFHADEHLLVMGHIKDVHKAHL